MLFVCTVSVISCTSLTQGTQERLISTESSTPTIVPQATSTTMPTTATAGTVTLEPTPTPCDDVPLQMSKLPDLSSLHWKTEATENKIARYLSGLHYSPIPVDTSPDNRWVAVAFQVSQGDAAVAIIDTRADSHWWVNTDDYLSSYYPPYQWLPDGRLLWVNETGSVFIGDGQEQRPLNEPEPMYKIWYATDDMAFARDKNGKNLWRTALLANTWEEIPDGALGIAQDGSYALVFQDDTLWRVPSEVGVTAERTPLEQVDIVGSGRPAALPRHLASSPYWLRDLTVWPEERIQIDDKAVWTLGVVVDERSGRVLNLDDFAIPSEYNHAARYSVSPDGAWLAISLLAISNPPRKIEKRAVYVTSSEDLTGGYLLEEATLDGWHTHPDAIIVRDVNEDTLAVARLPINDQSELLSLGRTGEVLATPPDKIAITEASSATRVLVFDFSGNLSKTFSVPEPYDDIEAGIGSSDKIYVSAVDQDNCVYAFVEWRLGASS